MKKAAVIEAGARCRGGEEWLGEGKGEGGDGGGGDKVVVVILKERGGHTFTYCSSAKRLRPPESI